MHARHRANDQGGIKARRSHRVEIELNSGVSAPISVIPLTPEDSIASGVQTTMLMGTLPARSSRRVAVTMTSSSATAGVALWREVCGSEALPPETPFAAAEARKF